MRRIAPSLPLAPVYSKTPPAINDERRLTTDPLGLVNGKVYDVLSVEDGWCRILDETEEDCLYPPDAFEMVDADEGATDKTDAAGAGAPYLRYPIECPPCGDNASILFEPSLESITCVNCGQSVVTTCFEGPNKAYGVEFLDDEGRTVAVLTISRDNLELA